MKIHAITQKPASLVNCIDQAVKEGTLKTWEIVKNNKKETLYNHTPEQWNGKALLQPYIYEGKVSFSIAWWTNNGEPEESIKGYIIGRFTEILMVHFKDYFVRLETYK